MELENLSPDFLEKVKACKTEEEYLALAKEEGIELLPEQLDAISGGNEEPKGAFKKCPNCGYDRAAFYRGLISGIGVYKCPNCGESFEQHVLQ